MGYLAIETVTLLVPYTPLEHQGRKTKIETAIPVHHMMAFIVIKLKQIHGEMADDDV